MGKNLIEASMNPVRQRILQYLSLHGKGTAGEMGVVLTDVPKASLYRHIKILLEAGAIEVESQQSVRGAVERTYAIAAHTAGEYTGDELKLMYQTAIMSVAASVNAYFQQPDADPLRDMLSISGATVMLTNEEYVDLLKAMGELLMKVAQNAPADGRKPRTITLVALPANN